MGVLEARPKLAMRFKGNKKLGGKGTQKRKQLNRRKKNNQDKNLKNLTQKLGAQKLPDINNINLFTNDNKVIQFKSPNVFGPFQNQTILVSGESTTNHIKDCFADVITEISPQQLEQLKNDNILPNNNNDNNNNDNNNNDNNDNN